MLTGLLAVLLAAGFEVAYSQSPYYSKEIIWNSQAYSIEYSLGRSNLKEIEIFETGLRFTLSDVYTGNDVLKVKLPMNLLRSLIIHDENRPIYEFIMILIDGQEITSLNISESTCQFLSYTIPFNEGSKSIEFIGPSPTGSPASSSESRTVVSPTIIEEGQSFRINIASTARQCNVSLDKEQKKLILDIEGVTGKRPLIVTIPHKLLGGQYSVFVNGTAVSDFNVEYNKDLDASKLSVPFRGEKMLVEVIGTTVIPEFAPVEMMFLLALMGIVLIIIGRLGYMGAKISQDILGNLLI
ncbi:MAG: hypothetical protein ABI347_04155 [Nitrososphaera sp.]